MNALTITDICNFEKIDGATTEEIEFMKNNIGEDKNDVMCWATDNEFSKLAKFLLQYAANTDRANYALISSSKYGDLEMVKSLVQIGADIHRAGNSALERSAENGHLEVIEYLVQNGANVHYWNDIALRLSAKNGHLGVVKYLIKNGANISVLSENRILELIKKNLILNNTGSKIMQEAWDTLVQPIIDNKNRVLGQVKTEVMSFLLKPNSIRVKVIEHEFTHRDNSEDYRYMD